MAGKLVGSGRERLVLEGSGPPNTSRLGNVHTKTLRAKVALLFASIAPMMPTAMGLPLTRRGGGGSLLANECNRKGEHFLHLFDRMCVKFENGTDTSAVLQLDNGKLRERLYVLKGERVSKGDFAPMKLLAEPDFYQWPGLNRHSSGCTAGVGSPDIVKNQWRLMIPEELKNQCKEAKVFDHGRAGYLEKAVVNLVLDGVNSLERAYIYPKFMVNGERILQRDDLLKLSLNIQKALLLLVAHYALGNLCSTHLKPSITNGDFSFSAWGEIREFANDPTNQDFLNRFSRFVESESDDDKEVTKLFKELIYSDTLTVDGVLDFFALENHPHLGFMPSMLVILRSELLEEGNVTMVGATPTDITSETIEGALNGLIQTGKDPNKEFDLSKLMPDIEESNPDSLVGVADSNITKAEHGLGLFKVLEYVLDNYVNAGKNGEALPDLLLHENSVTASNSTVESFIATVKHFILPALARYLESLGVSAKAVEPGVLNPTLESNYRVEAMIKNDFESIKYDWKMTLSLPTAPGSPLALLLAMFLGGRIRRKIQETSRFYTPGDELQKVMVQHHLLEYSLGHMANAGALVYRSGKNGQASTFGLTFMRSDNRWNTLVFNETQLSSFILENTENVQCLETLNAGSDERAHQLRMRGFLLSSIANLKNDVEYGLMMEYMLGHKLDVYVSDSATGSNEYTHTKTIEIDPKNEDPVINLLAKIDEEQELANLFLEFRQELINKIQDAIAANPQQSQMFILAREGITLSKLIKAEHRKTRHQLDGDVDTKLSAVLNVNDGSALNTAFQKMAVCLMDKVSRPEVLQILFSMAFSVLKAPWYTMSSEIEPSYVTRDEINVGNSTNVTFSVSGGSSDAQYRTVDGTPLNIVNGSLSDDSCPRAFTVEDCAARVRVTPGGEWHPIAYGGFVAGAIASPALYLAFLVIHRLLLSNQKVEQENVKLSRLIGKQTEPTQGTCRPDSTTICKAFLLAIGYLTLPLGASMAFDFFAVSNTDEDGKVNFNDGVLSGFWISLATFCLFKADDVLFPVKRTEPPEERVRKADQKASKLIEKINEGTLYDLIQRYSYTGEGERGLGTGALRYSDSAPPTQQVAVELTESPDPRRGLQADPALPSEGQDGLGAEFVGTLYTPRSEARSSTTRDAARIDPHSGPSGGPSPRSYQPAAGGQATAMRARLTPPRHGNGSRDDVEFEITEVGPVGAPTPGDEGTQLVVPVSILNQQKWDGFA